MKKYVRKFFKEFFKTLFASLKVLGLWTFFIGSIAELYLLICALSKSIGVIPTIIIAGVMLGVGAATVVAIYEVVQEVRKDKRREHYDV